MRVSPQDQTEFEARIRASLKFLTSPQQQGTIGSGLGMTFESCDLARRELVVSMAIQPWMYNPAATTVHGGVSAALADHALGTLVFSVNDCPFTPTVSLSLTYLRPVRLDRRLFIRASLAANGGRLATATGLAWSRDEEDDPAFSATGTFYLLKNRVTVSG